MSNRTTRFHFVNVFQTNKAMLVLCMGIALLVWLFTKLTKTYTTTIDVGITYTTPLAKTFRSEPSESIAVEVQGEGWQLMNRYLNVTSPTIQLKVQNNTTNINSQQIRQAIAEIIPNNIQITRFSPDNIAIALDLQETKKIPLVAAVESIGSSHYQLALPLQLRPDSITVAGPKTELAKLKNWHTDSISFRNLLDAPQGSIAISKHANKKVQFLMDKVAYSTKIEELTEKTLSIPIKIRNSPDSLQLFPRTVEVICKVGLSRYEDLYENSFEVIADFKNIDLQKAAFAPLNILKSPNGVRVLALKPNKVDFLVLKNKK